MLIRLMYKSTARQPMSDRTLIGIHALAATRNVKFGVTGFLNYNGTEFIQLVEGEIAHINQLEINLKKDERHHNFIELLREPIEKACFPHWSMQMLRVARKDLPEATRQTLASPTLSELSGKVPGEGGRIIAELAARGATSQT